MKSLNLKKLVALSITVAGLLMSVSAWPGVAVVVNTSNPNDLSGADITRIFLGKRGAFPDGSEVIPIDQTDGSATREAFVNTVLKKNNQQIKAYWAQLLFTGKGTPPKAVGGSAEVKKLIAENPALIGYIDTADVDASVKVVAEY